MLLCCHDIFLSVLTLHIHPFLQLSLLPSWHTSLQVAKDKLSVKYNGDARHANDVGSIQANRPAPKDRLIYYYEVHVLNRGEHGKIGVGFADDKFKSARQPGYALLTRGEGGKDENSAY